MVPYMAYIRVVKSLIKYRGGFDSVTVLREKLIYAKDKKEVLKILGGKYPQFFPENKVYQKETKNDAQFFYVVIHPLTQKNIEDLNSGEWECSGCGQKYDNKYLHRPRMYRNISEKLLFCPYLEFDHPDKDQYDYHEDRRCLNRYLGTIREEETPDNFYYITADSSNYIYKITEKQTGKSYIGKTKNIPFFRWFQHLKHSKSPFGILLRDSPLENWTFEILEVLPPDLKNDEVFKVESKYILQYDSINNGFNRLISNKEAVLGEDEDFAESQIE